MNRRDLLIMSGATLLLAGRASATNIDYTPGLVQQRLAAGETVDPSDEIVELLPVLLRQ